MCIATAVVGLCIVTLFLDLSAGTTDSFIYYSTMGPFLRAWTVPASTENVSFARCRTWQLDFNNGRLAYTT